MPGEKVLTRLIDLFESGVGGTLRPWQIRRVGAANAEARERERLLLEQTEKDIADIRAGRKRFDVSGKLITLEAPITLIPEDTVFRDVRELNIPTLSAQKFAQDAQDAAQALEMQRAVNLKRVALFAEEEAEELDRQDGGPQPTQETPPKVDVDWFLKWRTGAQDVSREEMQRLWAKLLAGEVSNPGTHSIFAIDVLSRLSPSDANLLARIAPFVTAAGIIKFDNDLLKNKNVSYKNLLYLEDIAILNGVTSGFGGPVYSPHISEFNGRALATLNCNETVLVFDMGDASKHPRKLSFEINTTTKVGSEILSLASFDADENYLNAIAEKALKEGAHIVQRGRLHPNGRDVLDLRTIAVKDDAT